MTPEQQQRLLAETRETADRLNKLNAFMASDHFPTLSRIDKDLLYKQQRVMSKYVQILGKRLERAGLQFTHANSHFLTQALLQDPETGEPLSPIEPPANVDGNLVFTVTNTDGTRCWQHTIRTEEV